MKKIEFEQEVGYFLTSEEKRKLDIILFNKSSMENEELVQ